MLEGLQDFVAGLPVWLQWAGVLLISTIPFIESYLGSVLGVVAGVPLVVAVLAAIVGNTVSMLAFVFSASGVRQAATGGREKTLSPRRERLRRAFDKYGVAGVSLLGQTILPSQITSAALVGFGASRSRVIFWQILSIIAWGVICGLIAAYGFDHLSGLGR